ncbi:MAG: DUF4133 domain-containing protein, partial [Sphingobacterium sp.]
YHINKGINRPIYFKGLQGQYIIYLALATLALMLLFLILFFLALPMLICVGTVSSLGWWITRVIYRFNNLYGEYGLLKIFAKNKTPKFISIRSRRVFYKLYRSKLGKEGRS